jgi:hypothetical protein
MLIKNKCLKLLPQIVCLSFLLRFILIDYLVEEKSNNLFLYIAIIVGVFFVIIIIIIIIISCFICSKKKTTRESSIRSTESETSVVSNE